MRNQKNVTWCYRCKKYQPSEEFILDAEFQYCLKCREEKKNQIEVKLFMPHPRKKKAQKLGLFVGKCRHCGLMLAEADRSYTDNQTSDVDEYLCTRCKNITDNEHLHIEPEIPVYAF